MNEAVPEPTVIPLIYLEVEFPKVKRHSFNRWHL